MKRNKIIASAIAGVLMLALTGCEMKIREAYEVGASVDKITEVNTDEFELTATKGLVEKEGMENSIDVAKFGTTWANQDAGSLLKFKNPLYGKDPSIYNKVTISFDMYAEKVQTFSGVFGLYDSKIGSFLWMTNSNCFINTTANNAGAPGTQFYFDYNTGNIAAGAADGLNTWMHIDFEITPTDYKYYVDSAEVFNETGVAGTGGDIKDGFEFLFKYADVARVGTGVTFWDNPGADTWIANITIKAE